MAFDLISDTLPFGWLWYVGAKCNREGNRSAKHHSRSDGAVIRIYDDAGNVIEMHEHKRDFRDW